MLEVRNIRAATFDLDRLDLWWEIESTSEDPQDYEFYILKSGSPLGPYTTIAGPLVDLYHYRDIQVGMLHQWKDLFYRVRLVSRSSGETIEFPADDGVSLTSRPTLKAMRIREEELVLFKEKNARVCWLYKRRRFGMRCPHCYNKFSGRSNRSNCATCFDTSFVGGYHSPIECLIQIDPTAMSEQHMSIGKTEQQNTTARALYFPPILPKDVIVEADNRRWRVVSVTPTELQRAVVHYGLQIHAIPAGDIEYALPIDVDEQNLQPSPPREFTNPHNPGELPEFARELWDFYTGVRR